MARNVSTNTYGVAKFVVSPDPTQGTHTTIQAAINDAVAGDTVFVRDGTFNENVTFKSGVTITALLGDSVIPNVKIVGTCVYASAGDCSVNNIAMETNGSYAFSMTGTNTGNIYFENCSFLATNFTGINLAAGANMKVSFKGCRGQLRTTSYEFIKQSGDNVSFFSNCAFSNPAGSLFPSLISKGFIGFSFCSLGLAFSISGTGSGNILSTAMDLLAINVPAFTTSGTAAISFGQGRIFSGTAAAFDIGAGSSLSLLDSTIASDAANAITGAGTVSYGNVSFAGSSDKISATNQTCYNSESFTPDLAFGGASVGITYSKQVGKYLRIMNMVYIEIDVVLSSKGTSSGLATLGGLPFQPASASSFAGIYSIPCTLVPITPPANSINFSLFFGAASARVNLQYFTSATAQGQLSNTNFSNTTEIRAQGFYFI